MTRAEELSRLEWDPRKHPRGKGGRWAHVPGGGGPGPQSGWSQDYVADVGEGFIPDLKPAKGFKALASKGRPHPPATGTADDPIDVEGDLNKALHLLHTGKHVRLNQPDEVSLLMDRVQEISKKAAGKGKRPTWDFGYLTVKGTNLFTAQTQGIPRVKMPQFSGLAQPGSTAARLAGGDGKFIDLAPQFVSKLRRDGIRVRRTTVPVSHLRATQTELDGAKVSGFADAARHGNEGAKKALGEPIFVTRDHYVIDGHHRWAANMLLDTLDGKLGDVPQNVTMIDMDIGAAIPYALEFANAMGIANRALSRALAILRLAGLAWDPAETVIDRRAWWDPKLHPRDPEGQFSKKAAKLDKVADGLSADATEEVLKGRSHSQHRASALTTAALEVRYAAQELRERKIEQAKKRLHKVHKRLGELKHGRSGSVAEELATLGMLALATTRSESLERAAAFEERLHPRDPHTGEWTDAPGGPGKVQALDPYYNEIPETKGQVRVHAPVPSSGRSREDDAAVKMWRAGHPVAPPITKAEARDEARPVSADEFQALAREGLNKLGTLAASRDGTRGLDANWDKIKADTWGEVQKSWGGATIEAASGKALPDGIDKYALSVKPQGMEKVSLPENASQAQFDKAMDEARERYRDELEKRQYYLGVFHDDDEGRIDIDPVLVVDTVHDVETVGAYSHAIGGAYSFATGDGVFPPYVQG